MGEYTYQSDLLVQKEDIVEGSNWITNDEYPIGFMIRLRNDTLQFFDSPESAEQFLDSIDCSELWGVSVETFTGVFGFYLNFQDLTSGHAQYVYWPRLQDGTLPSYNMPLFAFYPHLYAKLNGNWFDQILNDRSLYDTDPRPTSDFFIEDFKIGIQFETPNVIIQGSEAHGTPYQPASFVLSNDTHEVTATIDQAWNAGEYLENFYSHLKVVSQNEETAFYFNFEDMELAGFTAKYLDLHKQQFPTGLERLVLRAGMFGFGEYYVGTIVEIDPSTGTKYSTDNYDLWREFPTWKTGNSYGRIGKNSGGTSLIMYIAFDTGINEEITDTSSVSLQMYCYSCSFDTSSEGAGCRVYNIGGNANSNTAKENSLNYNIGTNKYEDLVYAGNIGSGAYKTANTGKMGSLTDYWGDNRGDSEEYISFYFYNVGAETNDYYQFRESQYGGIAYDPKLSFTYSVPPPETIEISGYVKEIGSNDPIQGATIELYEYGSTWLNSTSTNSQGYYTFRTIKTDNPCDLWAYHEDYVKQSKQITPNADQSKIFS
ncbi:MAG: hypothetical protein ACFE9L_14660 [Candidatus Hodarchaeota archaeon]